MRNRNLLTIAITLILFSASSSAGMYKWVDAQGQTHYSQTRPGNRPATSIKADPAPVQSTPASRESEDLIQKRLQALDDSSEDRQIKKQTQTKDQNIAKIKEKNCAAAKNNLRALEGPPQRLVNGKRLSVEEREKMKEDNQKALEENCKKS